MELNLAIKATNGYTRAYDVMKVFVTVALRFNSIGTIIISVQNQIYRIRSEE